MFVATNSIAVVERLILEKIKAGKVMDLAPRYRHVVFRHTDEKNCVSRGGLNLDSPIIVNLSQ